MCRGSWVKLTTTGWVRNSTHSCRLSIDSDLSRRSGKLSREFIRVNRRWYSCWLEIIFMSYFYKSENEDWHMLILMLLSCILHDNHLTCSWVLTLTEFGCKLFQLQDWILLSTVPTDGEILQYQKVFSFCILVSDPYTGQVCIWNIMFLREFSPGFFMYFLCTLQKEEDNSCVLIKSHILGYTYIEGM
jgi:hypothetical protein